MAGWALAELPVAIININANEDQGSERLQNGFVMIISGLHWREVLDQVLSYVWCLGLWRSKAHFLKWGLIKRCGHVVFWSESGRAPSFHLAHLRIEVHARIPRANTGKHPKAGFIFLVWINGYVCQCLYLQSSKEPFEVCKEWRWKLMRCTYLWICIILCLVYLPGSIIFFYYKTRLFPFVSLDFWSKHSYDFRSRIWTVMSYSIQTSLPFTVRCM